MQAVLFDLDGTLLDIDLELFLGTYFEALEAVLVALDGNSAGGPESLQAIMTATNAMMQPHPEETNSDAFYRVFAEQTGVDLQEHWQTLERFYEEVFPTLGEHTRPVPGVPEALQAARACDLKIAVATNPIFPLRAIEHRMAWAGIASSEVDAITSFEIMRATKPHAEYFRQIAEMLSVRPDECLMVGDDRMLDLAAADVGMRTFYVGEDAAPSDYRGSLLTLAQELPRLCGRV